MQENVLGQDHKTDEITSLKDTYCFVFKAYYKSTMIKAT